MKQPAHHPGRPRKLSSADDLQVFLARQASTPWKVLQRRYNTSRETLRLARARGERIYGQNRCISGHPDDRPAA